ncbi:aminopeptidase [Geosporobacter ferrireducens]|uniref:M18 family aminopeptidase n=1 Tax=Geosporobacter ferrireducens TaxID=1424294 RepID=A0A1D8GP23_9FIRM|nr:aminopeptidase [Geosporobacter ferrireducens]AOT72701.1 aminopeptidase [Geosporobacter ferrireducens]MTI55110.1 aminopeptidase [Geosporobacter ferrireducens]
MSDNLIGKELRKKVIYEFKTGWDLLTERENKVLLELNEEYKSFLDRGKTERECIREIIETAKEHGYVSIKEVIAGEVKLEPGTKIYANNRDKAAVMLVIGSEPLEKGMHIVGAHVDVPRLDLKPNPLYEDGGMAFFKTHYYGGIKKYQWTAIPLALHGVVIKKNGEKLNIVIGEDEKDPVFFITDLLPHLAKDQAEKKLSEGITGEGLNILIGSIPFKDQEIKERVKLNIMRILNEKYGIYEDDFFVAEVEAVPAGKAKDVGFDKSMVGAHGHDDRVCAFTALKAVLDIETPNKTAVALFVDKEEVGSMGNTGMESRFFENVVAELIAIQNQGPIELLIRRSMANSKVLSGDVGAAFDPNFPDVLDKRNAAYLGKGVILVKYTGVRGKSGSNDANAEFLAEIRNIFNDNEVLWQVGELGKVDQGGGGTIAYILANYGAEVVDCGVPVLSMHAPLEIVSKVDVYMTYKAYHAFFKV